MRRYVAVVLVVAGCGDGEGIDATTAPPAWPAAAAEYAASARRALEGTRFADLGDEWLADLVMGACEAVEAGRSEDDVVAAAVAGVEAPEGDAVDDEILHEVLTVGLEEVCPGVTVEGRSAFLGAARPIVATSGLTVADDDLVTAAVAMCSALGGDAEQAVLGVFSDLFGAGADSIDDLTGVGSDEGAVVGAVLGAGTTHLCPEHAPAVQAYLDQLSGRVEL